MQKQCVSLFKFKTKNGSFFFLLIIFHKNKLSLTKIIKYLMQRKRLSFSIPLYPFSFSKAKFVSYIFFLLLKGGLQIKFKIKENLAEDDDNDDEIIRE